MADRPRLLDLFCGAGGAAVGYHRAGFDVVGVDLAPQPDYPFDFVRHDALDLNIGYMREFDAIHASPPCQAHSSITKVNGTAHLHPQLIEPTRDLLNLVGLPYVIENVVGAPLLDPVQCCGSILCPTIVVDGVLSSIRRHRRFESNVKLIGSGCDFS